MHLIPWLRSLLSGPARPQPRRTRLLLEALEDRTVPSTFKVTNLADSGPGSLRAAITAANTAPGDDVIKFAGGLKGTITLASELSITDDLTIDGPDADKLTVSGNNTVRAFHVSGSATQLAIDGLTIANGRVSVPLGNALGGGLLNDGASVRLSEVVFVGNQAVGSGAGGGAVANIGRAHLTAEDTDFQGNSVSGSATNFADGGAVYDDQNAIVDIAHGTFSGNQATGGNANGGAIGHYGGSQLTLASCSFDDNQIVALFPGSPIASAGEDAAGGAIESDSSISGFFGVTVPAPTMTITDCSFTDNVARAATSPAGQDGGSAEGGALAVEDAARATVRDSTFESNRARGGDGGAGSAGMNGGFGGGSAAGAVFNASGILTVSDSLFRGNETQGGNGGKGGDGGGNGGDGAAFTPGGAIDATELGGNVAPTTALDNCRFVDNQATGGNGGAGGSGGNGGNGNRGDGGAIINFAGTMTVRDCAIVDNTAQGGTGGAPGTGGTGGVGGLGRGGGFSNELGGTATLSDTSIVRNQATGGAGTAGHNGGNAVGGGVYNGRFLGQAATLELLDCTVRANLATGGAGGVGGSGGYALGGGILNGNTNGTGLLISSPGTFPRLDLDDTKVTANQAVGGAAGSGGSVGVGVGGGLYNQTGAVAELDAQSKVQGNEASTFDDDISGTVTPV